MRFELKEVSICAEKEFELIRITDPVREFVAQTGVKNGVVYVITKTILTIITTICPPTAPSAAMHPAISRVCSRGTTAFFRSQRARSSWAAQRIFISASTMASKTANI